MTDLQLSAVPAVQERARLRLTPGLPRLGPLDGGWWPRSRSASAELAELVPALVDALGWVSRLTVGADDWDEIPHRAITVDGRRIRVGFFPDLNHSIIVTRGRLDTFLLLVVPPDTEPDAAATALDRASAGPGGATPRQILADCGRSDRTGI